MTDLLGNPHKKPQNTLHVLKSINNKNNPYIIKMHPDSPHKQNRPVPPLNQTRISRRAKKDSCGQWSPPDPKQGEKFSEKNTLKNLAWT